MKRFNTLLTATQIANITGGVVAGNPDEKISSVAALNDADQTSLVFFQDKKFRSNFQNTKSRVIIIPRDLPEAGLPNRTYIRVDSPYVAFLMVVKYLLHLDMPQRAPGKHIHPSAAIHESVVLPENITIGAHVTIEAHTIIADQTILDPGVVIMERCTIGTKTHLFPNVTVYPETVVGDRVRIHAGSVIGADGFGYIWDGSQHQKVPQIGRVIIENDVEIGANSCIDRGALGNTIIHNDAKIDNLVQIGHNVSIGGHAICCAQVGIAGSSSVGNNCILAGQVGVADHVAVGNFVTVAAQSGISRNVDDKQIIFGTPALDAKLQRKIILAQRELPAMRKFYHQLKKEVEKEGSK